MELREYQAKSLDGLRETFTNTPKPVRIMCQLPTGTGKTGVAMWLAKLWVEKALADGRNVKVLWLTHRTELKEQAYAQAKLWEMPIFSVNFQHLEVYSPLKIFNRIKKAEEFDGCPWAGLGVDDHSLMIVDEAHHASARTWKGAIGSFPGAVIGFTATPYRLSKKEGFDDIFNDLVKGPSMQWFIEAGYLCNLRAWHVPAREGEVMGVGGGSFGEYNITQTEKAITARSNEYAVQWCLDMCDEHNVPKRIIAFCLSVNHAKMVCKAFEDKGVKAGVIYSQQHARERADVVKAFGDGDIDVMANVNIATEGFDCPDARVILMLRPTKSKALFLQMAGRGTRMSEGKDFCMILDATDNCQRFGLPQECDMNTDWNLKARGENTDGEAPVRYCDECHAVNHAAATVCCSCGAVLRAPCDYCNRYRNVDDLEPMGKLTSVCGDCRGEYADDFNDAVEVQPITLEWKLSQNYNETVQYHTARTSYRLTVYPNKKKAGKWCYIIFQSNQDEPSAYSGNCKSQVSAKERGADKLKQIIRADVAEDDMMRGKLQTDIVLAQDRDWAMVAG